MSQDNKPELELRLEDYGFKRCLAGESTDEAQEVIHRWYKKYDPWMNEYYWELGQYIKKGK